VAHDWSQGKIGSALRTVKRKPNVEFAIPDNRGEGASFRCTTGPPVRGRAATWIAEPRERRPRESEKAAWRGAEGDSFTLPWLPLPEKAGSDRDEPHCLPGFVDRAYLVFLSNYGPQLLLHRTAPDRPT
jgi:hypothetical protein